MRIWARAPSCVSRPRRPPPREPRRRAVPPAPFPHRPSTRYATVVTTRDHFEPLLSVRARINVPISTVRPAMSPLYEFGGGLPDPASFPYDGMIEATRRMMQAEG